MEENMQTRNNKYERWILILTLLVLLSLFLNGYLIVSLAQARSRALQIVAAAQNTIQNVDEGTLVVPVRVDQDIPLNTIIPISQTFSIPLKFDYPLSTVVNTSIEIPLLGTQDLAVPIDAVIPIDYVLDVPLQIAIPISLTYRLQMEVPVEIAIPEEMRGSLDELFQQAENALK